MPEGCLDKLESTQCQLLRGTTHQWRHKGGVTNPELRRSHLVPTVRSALRFKRLVWWSRQLSRSSGPETLRILAKGELTVGAHRVGASQGLLWPLLRADILALGVALGTPLIGRSDQELEQFLLDTSRPRLREVYEFEEAARRNPRGGGATGEQGEEKFLCPTCSNGLHTSSQLATHRRHSHNFRTPLRDMVQSPKCPACLREFASIDSARTHLTQGKCVESKSPSFLERVKEFAPPERVDRSFRGPNPSLVAAVLTFWGLDGAEANFPRRGGGNGFGRAGDLSG